MRINNKFEFKVAQTLLLAQSYQWRVSGNTHINLDNDNFPVNICSNEHNELTFRMDDLWEKTLSDLLNEVKLIVTDIPLDGHMFIEAIFKQLNLEYIIVDDSITQITDDSKLKLSYKFNDFMDKFDDNIYVKRYNWFLTHDNIKLLSILGDKVVGDYDYCYAFNFNTNRWEIVSETFEPSLRIELLNVRDLKDYSITSNVVLIENNDMFNNLYNNKLFKYVEYIYSDESLAYHSSPIITSNYLSTYLYHPSFKLIIKEFFKYNNEVYKVSDKDNYVYKGVALDGSEIIVEQRMTDNVTLQTIKDNCVFIFTDNNFYKISKSSIGNNIIPLDDKSVYVTDDVIQLNARVVINNELKQNYIETVDSKYLCYELLEFVNIKYDMDIYEYSGRCKTVSDEILFKKHDSTAVFNIHNDTIRLDDELIFADFDNEDITIYNDVVDYDISVYLGEYNTYSNALLYRVREDLRDINNSIYSFEAIRKCGIFRNQTLNILTYSRSYAEFDGRYLIVHLDCFGVKEEYKYIITNEFRLILC